MKVIINLLLKEKMLTLLLESRNFFSLLRFRQSGLEFHWYTTAKYNFALKAGINPCHISSVIKEIILYTLITTYCHSFFFFNMSKKEENK
jgi:hypothetical protein